MVLYCLLCHCPSRALCSLDGPTPVMHDMLCVAAQVVMPPLLHSAQLKPDVHITDLESTSDNEDEDDEVRRGQNISPALSRRSTLPRGRTNGLST